MKLEVTKRDRLWGDTKQFEIYNTSVSESFLLKFHLTFSILSNYIAWTIIEKVIDHLPDKYGEAHLVYKKRINGETYDAQERWITCFEATKNAFPMAIGLIFVDKKLSSEAKERVWTN